MQARMLTIVELVEITGSDMPVCAFDSLTATRRVMMVD